MKEYLIDFALFFTTNSVTLQELFYHQLSLQAYKLRGFCFVKLALSYCI